MNLAEIAGILNKTAQQAQYQSEAANLQKAMQMQMWNASAGMYCDGVCADTVSIMNVIGALVGS